MGGKSSTSFTSACFFLPLFPFIFVIFTHLCFALSSFLSLLFFPLTYPLLPLHGSPTPICCYLLSLAHPHIRTSQHACACIRSRACVNQMSYSIPPFHLLPLPILLLFSTSRMCMQYFRLGQTTSAISQYAKAEKALTLYFGQSNIGAGILQHNLARISEEKGELSTAIDHFEAARKIKMEVLQTDSHPLVAISTLHEGVALSEMRRKDGMHLISEAEAALLSFLGNTHVTYAKALEAHVRPVPCRAANLPSSLLFVILPLPLLLFCLFHPFFSLFPSLPPHSTPAFYHSISAKIGARTGNEWKGSECRAHARACVWRDNR
mmetsp:Transcript_5585/g.12976  ORF Transcript_5585/g.12976 Transcript_5585/m.12976 type:complete len:321 (-) Transcript_5585:1295-2257(-)